MRYVYHSFLRPVLSISQYLPKGWEFHGHVTKPSDHRSFSVPEPLTPQQIDQWQLDDDKQNHNPRFVWLVGAVSEMFEDVPDQKANGELVLWDRQEQKAVLTVAPEYAQAMVLEHVEHGCPFSDMVRWFNQLDGQAMKSEGLVPTKDGYTADWD